MKKLELNKRREFGDCISDGFRIIGNNFRSFSTGFLLYVFPIVLFASLSYFITSGPGEEQLGLFEGSSPIYMIALYGGSLLGSIMISAVIYAIFILSDSQSKGKIEFAEIQVHVLPIFAKIIPIYLLMIVVFAIPLVLIIALSTLSQVFFILFAAYFVLAIYLMVPFGMAPFIRVFEDKNLFETIARSFQLIKKNWWPAFGVYVITMIICFIASTSLIFPITIITFVREFSGLAGDDPVGGAQFIQSFTLMFSLAISLFVSSYFYACINLKYFDLVEKLEGKRLKKRILEFGTSRESLFENEGDY